MIKTRANAQDFTSMNNSYLRKNGVNAVVTGISVDAGNNTVLVQVSANLDRLFPSVVPIVAITEYGYVEVQLFAH